MKIEKSNSQAKEVRLQEAIESGELIKIIYYGGSNPGNPRMILPISIKNGKMYARCLISNIVKAFLVEKVEVLGSVDNVSTIELNHDVKKLPHYKSFIDLQEKEKNYLIKLGWHVENGKDYFSLHRRFKNGKSLKSADVLLTYEEFTYDIFVDIDGEEHEGNLRKRQRPWMVSCKNKNTRTFGSLDKAANIFLEWSKELAPSI